jgi:hypothetical protein
MPFAHVLRWTAVAITVVAALSACQGDDNSLPLPPDAGHSDASVHEGGTDSGSNKDSSMGDAAVEAEVSEASVVKSDSGADSAPPDAGAAMPDGADAATPDSPVDGGDASSPEG